LVFYSSTRCFNVDKFDRKIEGMITNSIVCENTFKECKTEQKKYGIKGEPAFCTILIN